jgi:hypothetical protein
MYQWSRRWWGLGTTTTILHHALSRRAWAQKEELEPEPLEQELVRLPCHRHRNEWRTTDKQQGDSNQKEWGDAAPCQKTNQMVKN